MAPVELDALRKELADLEEQSKADDPKELRKRIAELEKELRAKSAAIDVPKVVEVRLPFFDSGAYGIMFEKILDELGRIGRVTQEARDEIGRRLKGYQDAAQAAVALGEKAIPRMAIEGTPKASEPWPVKYVPPRPPAGPSVVHRDPKPGNGSAHRLPAGERVVLTAIAQHPDGVTREQLTVLTGYKRSTRDAYIQRMSVAGSVEQRGERIHATQAGIERLGDFVPLPTGRALLDHWLRELPEGERRVLECVAEVYPNAAARTSIDAITGFKRSTRDAYLQRLTARRLVTPFGNGNVGLSPELVG